MLRSRWRLLARLGRYGKQPVAQLLDFSMDDLRHLDDALEGWLELESRPVKG